MSMSSLFKTVCQSVNYIAPRILSVKSVTSIASSKMHHMSNRQYLPSLSSICTNQSSLSGFLQPSLPTYNIVCGLKMKNVLHRRCRNCLLLWKEGRKYIKCSKHGRHNQVQRQKREYKTWILTHASQSRVRDW